MTNEKRAEMISIVKNYLDHLINHDGNSLSLAPDCWRSEQAKCAAKPAEGIRQAATDPIMMGNIRYRDLRLWVDNEDVIAFFLLDIQEGTVHLAERFRVVDGLIHEIEAIYHIDPEKNKQRWPLDENDIWTTENTLSYISPVILD